MKASERVIAISGVSKRFRLYHERPSSLKERVVNRRRSVYEDFWALKDVEADIFSSQTVGLIGPNGSGKSTLLKLVAGIFRPTEGRIETWGRIASLLELGAGFHPDLTGRENVFMNASILGLSRRQTERNFDAIVAFAGLEDFIDLQVRHYSSGMYVRLGFAVAVHVDPEILIVDEVLAVGDEAFQRKCLDRIRLFQSDGRTIVFVTHAVDLVRQICTRALFLHKGLLVADGKPPDVIREYRQLVHGEEHLEAAPLQDRGTFEIRIAEVRFLDAEGVERQIFSPGEPLEIAVTVTSQLPVDDPHMGIAIYDETGACIYGTNTILRAVDIGRVDGKVRVRFRVPSLPMLDGRCEVSVGIHSGDERRAYHCRERAYAFRILNAGVDVGTMYFGAKIEVERL